MQNEILGSKSKPTIFAGAQFSEQIVNLNKGWTWTSFFVEDARFSNIKEVFEDLTLEKGDQLKTFIYNKDVNDADQDNDITDFIGEVVFTNFENDNWYGPLSTLENSKMYKVKMANKNPLRLIGNDIDEANLDINIQEGWNWLPFPIHRNISVPEALSFYNPIDGDVIKDQFNFAIYDTNSGWSGTLNYMQSNRGYMIKSGAKQILNYPNSENASKSPGQEHSDETIALFSKYNGSMSIVAEVIASEKYSKVVVYDLEGNIRGESPIINLNNKSISFISVFSNVNDVLKFKLSDGINEVNITNNFVFENNKVYGDLKTPVILSLKSLSTDDLFLNNTVVYPNPFSESITISAIEQTEKLTKIEIYSTIGALLIKVRVKKNKTIINTASYAKGIYLIKLTSETGNMIIKKMVKK